MRRYELDINGRHFSIAVRHFSAKRAELEIDGTTLTVDVANIVNEGVPTHAAGVIRARPLPTQSSLPVRGHGAGAADGPGVVTAPIPGQILALLVKEGDAVTVGQPLLKLEAMKMENTILATVAGTVTTVNVRVGDAVMQGQELMAIG
jgi:biotin carboxyl carrier protein